MIISELWPGNMSLRALLLAC